MDTRKPIEHDIPITGEQLVAWAELYELAALGFLATTREFAGVLASGDYAAACDEAAGETGAPATLDTGLLESYAGMDADEVFHELRRERTRLFVGERKPIITPYAGIRHAEAKGQRGVLMVGAESMAIERFMRRCGIVKDLSSGQANDPVDHIGTMCEFMQYLCLVSARAVAPVQDAHITWEDTVDFHEKHFSPYASWCAGRLRDEARTPYYRFQASMLDCLSSTFPRKEIR